MTSSLLDHSFLTSQNLPKRLEALAEALKNCDSISQKLQVLNSSLEVQEFLKGDHPICSTLQDLPAESELVIKAVIAAGQAEKVFFIPPFLNSSLLLQELLDQLLSIEKFYAEIGGIVGYQAKVLNLLLPKQEESAFSGPSVRYLQPDGIVLSRDSSDVRQAVIFGIEHMQNLAEIYPVGGAADRLRLQDEKTGVPLPAARLLFCGKTLLEWLIADLQAREYLHYKLFNKQLVTPVAMMTSCEKGNHAQILNICQENEWFGRPKESFFFFRQPSVPTVNRQGMWCLQGPLQPLLKPGGHGAMWKLARDAGVFNWLDGQGCKKALIRQINNPIASIDHGLLAFTGWGFKHDKIFGFASCPRQVKASEGINVLIEKQHKLAYEYTLTNIEYCDFTKFKIADEPAAPLSPFSIFSSNTNILFADLNAIKDVLFKCPFPGILINFKKAVYQNESGHMQEEEIGRLESTMQNIADGFSEIKAKPLSKGKRADLKTFLTYNARHKTISTAKREFVLGASLLETPEGCFLNVLKNSRELLVKHCGVKVPLLSGPKSFFTKGPSFVFLYHPALGPLYSIIGQKMRKGRLFRGSELQLNIAELEMENLVLKGSLLIRAEAIMGQKNAHGVLEYSNQVGKCVLRNVKVINQGIERDAPNVFWRNEIFRKEVCSILIKGSGEFCAENVTLPGDLKIEIEDGIRVVAVSEKGQLRFKKQQIEKPILTWEYRVTEDFRIALKKR